MTTFSQEILYAQLAASSQDELDAISFGVIELDEKLTCTRYNKAESNFSGLRAANVVGRHFFEEVAPCMNNYMVRDRLLGTETLDDIIDYVLSVRMSPTPVRLRLLVEAGQNKRFLVVEFPTE